MNVGYKVHLGSLSLAPGEGTLIWFRTSSSLEVPVNEGVIRVVNDETVSLKQGDPVTIEGGYDSALKTLFTGVVERITTGFEEMEIHCAGSFRLLVGRWVNLSYEEQSSGDMVKDILGLCGIKSGKVESGLSYADYYISDGRSLWENCRLLAERNGFDFFASPEDEGIFAPYAPGTPVSLVYGEDILEMEEESFASSFDGFEVFGESPVGQGEGEEASSWLTKKEVKGTGGKTSGNLARITDYALRNRDNAGKTAENRAASLKTVLRGRALVIGNAGVIPGGTVNFKKLPSSFKGGNCKVRGVKHLVDVSRGFVTEISWEKTE